MLLVCVYHVGVGVDMGMCGYVDNVWACVGVVMWVVGSGHGWVVPFSPPQTGAIVPPLRSHAPHSKFVRGDVDVVRHLTLIVCPTALVPRPTLTPNSEGGRVAAAATKGACSAGPGGEHTNANPLC